MTRCSLVCASSKKHTVSVAMALALFTVPVLGADVPNSGTPGISLTIDEAIAIQLRLDQQTEIIREQQRQIEKLRARYDCT